jgi:hypothetical protein
MTQTQEAQENSEVRKLGGASWLVVHSDSMGTEALALKTLPAFSMYLFIC